jgi:hypothetical protein
MYVSTHMHMHMHMRAHRTTGQDVVVLAHVSVLSCLFFIRRRSLTMSPLPSTRVLPDFAALLQEALQRK